MQKDAVRAALRRAIHAVAGDNAAHVAIEVELPKEAVHGDWTTTVAFALARHMRRAPADIAQAIAAALRADKVIGDAAITAVGGYVNIALSPVQYAELLQEIATAGSAWGTVAVGDKQRVLLEYVSANPTGPLTLGNARGGPYGDTLANVLIKAGYVVSREYYINDAGNQIDILGHSVCKTDQAQYAGAYIDALRATCGATCAQGDLQAVGRCAAAVIVEEMIKPALADAGITFDRWFSERSLHESGAVDRAIAALRDAGYTYEDDGALYFRSTDFGDDKDRVLVKRDGGKTYFCVDIAYHCDKLARADKLINIWGADHGGTVARLKGALAALGHESVLDIILTQFVRVMEDGKEVKMSKRRGTYITLADLVEEVGADVVRFLFLMQSATSHVVFDMDRARMQSEKNPVYYVQYAHARMASILRKAQAQGYEPATTCAPLVHEKERALVRVLAQLPDIIASTAHDYGVHRLPHYAIRIADALHAFYAACRVIDAADPVRTATRLLLVATAKDVLAEVLRIAGVRAPTRM